MIYIKFSDGAQGTLMKVGKRWAYTEQKLNDEAHSALLMFLPEEQVQEDQHKSEPEVSRFYDFKLDDFVELTSHYSFYQKGARGRIVNMTKASDRATVNFGTDVGTIEGTIPVSMLRPVTGHISNFPMTSSGAHLLKVGDQISFHKSGLPEPFKADEVYELLEIAPRTVTAKPPLYYFTKAGKAVDQLVLDFSLHSLIWCYQKRAESKPVSAGPDDWQPGDFVMCVKSDETLLTRQGCSYTVKSVAGASVIFAHPGGYWAKSDFIKVKPEAERVKELLDSKPNDQVYVVDDTGTSLTLGYCYTVLRNDDYFMLREYNSAYDLKYFQLKDPK